MRIGIGLPNAIPGVTGTMLLEWARRAEARGFAFLTTISRVAYPSHDSLTTLAAVAGVTSRVGLVTNVVLGPTYPDAVLAKIVNTVAEISGGRLTLGLGVGSRRSDYVASGRSFTGRGAALDQQVEFLRRARRGEPLGDGDLDGERHAVGPSGADVPILVGGRSERAIRRTAERADGWTGAGGGPRAMEPVVARVLDAWRQAERPGQPRLLGAAYFGTDDQRRDESDTYLRRYYAFSGDRIATANAEAAVYSPSQIRGVVTDLAAIGMNELTFSPTLPRLEEVDRLADVVL